MKYITLIIAFLVFGFLCYHFGSPKYLLGLTALVFVYNFPSTEDFEDKVESNYNYCWGDSIYGSLGEVTEVVKSKIIMDLEDEPAIRDKDGNIYSVSVNIVLSKNEIIGVSDNIESNNIESNVSENRESENRDSENRDSENRET